MVGLTPSMLHVKRLKIQTWICSRNSHVQQTPNPLAQEPEEVPPLLVHSELEWKYSQTWANGHLTITTTCLQRRLIWSSNLSLSNIELWTSEQRPPVNNGHKFGVPRVVVVHKFNCISFSIKNYFEGQTKVKTISHTHSKI